MKIDLTIEFENELEVFGDYTKPGLRTKKFERDVLKLYLKKKVLKNIDKQINDQIKEYIKTKL